MIMRPVHNIKFKEKKRLHLSCQFTFLFTAVKLEAETFHPLYRLEFFNHVTLSAKSDHTA